MSLKQFLDRISFHGSNWFDEFLNDKCDNAGYLNLGSVEGKESTGSYISRMHWVRWGVSDGMY